MWYRVNIRGSGSVRPFHEQEQVAYVSEAQELEQNFPMWVVHVREVLKMTKLRPHQELLDDNLLIKYEEAMGIALFMSHQWVAFANPDPKFEQFQTLIDALRNIIGGKIVVQNGYRKIIAEGNKGDT